MATTLFILFVAWLALDLAVFVLVARRARPRDDRRGPRLRRRRCAVPVDGYASLLLSRMLVQTCRVVGAAEACLFLRDPSNGDVLVPVAAHGLDEGLLGRRIDTDDGGWRLELSAGDGDAIDTAAGVAVPVVRSTTGECGYLWATAGPAGQLGDRQTRLLTELAELCGRALDDIDRPARLDDAIGRALARVTAHDRPAAGRHAALARAVGERLGLDGGALLELDMTARVQHAVPVAPAAAVRAMPGFESVAIALRFADERWDGAGPHGLRGDRIPLASRVLAVCAAFDGDLDRSLRAIQAASGSRFDPAVVTALSHELLGPIPEFEPPITNWADGDRLFAGLVTT